jgi:sulfide:quinone oxidoreductase
MSLPHQEPLSPDAYRVVIAGGGVAAVEAALALQDLAGSRVALTIVAASSEFVYRPFAVVRPFQPEPTYQIKLTQIASDVGADIVFDTAVGLNPTRRRLLLSSGESLVYDALLIAIGARAEATVSGGTITPWDWGGGHSFRAMLDSIRNERTKNVTFIVPAGTVWALPLYELALLTSAFVAEEALSDVSLTLVTVEQAPLAVFGAEASAKVRALLQQREIALLLESEAVSIEDGVVQTSGGASIPSDATIAVPVIRPHAFAGVPTDDEGFIIVDQDCRIRIAGNVFAAGDCTQLPHKQGGIAAQQADAAAAQIAALAGAGVEPKPFRPRLQALLFTGETPLRLDATGRTPDGDREVGPERPEKIKARYLTPYLRGTNPSLPTLAG